MSTFIDRILLTVSINVSPFLTEDCEAEKLITSADNRFSASSNDNLVQTYLLILVVGFTIYALTNIEKVRYARIYIVLFTFAV